MKRLFCIALLAIPEMASATRVSVREVPCPIGDGLVKVYEKITANTHGGFDSDLASYSSQGQFREFAISTCIDNHLSLYGSDMTHTWTEAERTSLEQHLEELTIDLNENWGLHAVERYHLAGQIYTALERDPLFLAELYLQASWVSRDAVVGVLTGLEGPSDARRFLNEGQAALETEITDAQRTILLHNLARVAHRGGYVEERDIYLTAFASLPLTDTETEILQTMRWGIEREAEFQDLAIAAFMEGLEAEGLNTETELRSTYILADLLRRRQRSTESIILFENVYSHESSPTDLRVMSQFLYDDISENQPNLPMQR